MNYYFQNFKNLSLGLDCDKRMIEFVKNITIEERIKQRLVTDNSNFIEIDQYQVKAAFPKIFEKDDKFDCFLADLGINRYYSI